LGCEKEFPVTDDRRSGWEEMFEKPPEIDPSANWLVVSDVLERKGK